MPEMPLEMLASVASIPDASWSTNAALHLTGLNRSFRSHRQVASNTLNSNKTVSGKDALIAKRSAAQPSSQDILPYHLHTSTAPSITVLVSEVTTKQPMHGIHQRSPSHGSGRNEGTGRHRSLSEPLNKWLLCLY